MINNAPSSSCVGEFAKATHHSNKGMLTTTLLVGIIQAGLLVLFFFGTTYNSKDYNNPREYVVFRDILVMMLGLLGFLLTTTLPLANTHNCGRLDDGVVDGFTMMMALWLTAIAVQLNVLVEPFGRYLLYYGEDAAFLPLPLKLSTFIDGEVAAATLMISLGAIIG